MRMILVVLAALGLLLFGCAGQAPVKDCGTDDKCFQDAISTCTPAKAVKTDQSGTYNGLVKGYQGDKCVINMKIVESSVPILKDKEMTCNIPKDKLSGFSGGGSAIGGGEDVFSMCSGSLVDLMKSLGVAGGAK